MERKSKDDSVESQYSILNMKCKFYPTIHLWFLSDNVSQGVQHRSLPHLLPPSKPRNSFSMENHCLAVHKLLVVHQSLWTARNDPKCVFHVLSTCLQSRWKHEIEREDSWSFQFHIMSTKDLRSLNSGHYCKTGFLDFLVKSSWNSQPGAMPRFQFDLGASARFNGTCNLFPEICSFFEQEL